MAFLTLFKRHLSYAKTFLLTVRRPLPTPLPAEQLFLNGKPIVIPGTTLLCNSFYAVLYDEQNKRAILSASVTQPKGSHIERENDFHPDPRIAASPHPADYIDTGFDRGHLTPAADAGTEDEMIDTFLMTNMTPQHPKLNRENWRMLEEHCRKLDTKYIVTGTVYSEPSEAFLGATKIPVPTSYWKALYLSDGSVRAFEAMNNDNAEVTETSLDLLEKKLGYTIFYR